MKDIREISGSRGVNGTETEAFTENVHMLCNI